MLRSDLPQACWTSCTRSATPSSHRRWLKAGVMEGKELSPHGRDLSRGRNLAVTGERALHGMETAIRDAFPERKSSTSPG